jgi:hypothetical protein
MDVNTKSKPDSLKASKSEFMLNSMASSSSLSLPYIKASPSYDFASNRPSTSSGGSSELPARHRLTPKPWSRDPFYTKTSAPRSPEKQSRRRWIVSETQGSVNPYSELELFAVLKIQMHYRSLQERRRKRREARKSQVCSAFLVHTFCF